MDMTLAELEGPITCVRLNGRLDAPGADAIGVRVTAAIVASGRDALVDLSGVTFVASMGIRLLISVARAAATKGHRVAVFGASGPVRDALDSIGLAELMPVVPTETEALAAIA